jgi:hypothetical protein
MKKHPIAVEGYPGSLEELAQKVCRMRYDQVAEFFGYCAVELLRQANGDMQRGRKLLAIQLTSARGIAIALHQKVHRIFRLCEPHMQEELAADPPTFTEILR